MKYVIIITTAFAAGVLAGWKGLPYIQATAAKSPNQDPRYGRRASRPPLRSVP